MDWTLTIAGLCGGLALFALAIWRAGRPYVPLKPPIAPWKLVVLIAGFWCFLMLVHLVSLAGLRPAAAPV